MGCVETKQFDHAVKPVNFVVADTNERTEASARRRKKVEEQHQRSQSAAKSISNVALQNSEKLSTATDRSRKSFMSDLLALNEINKQNQPCTSHTPSPDSYCNSPTDDSKLNSPDNLPNKLPNSKTQRSKMVAFEEPNKDVTDSVTQDENSNDRQTNLQSNGNTNAVKS